MAKIKDQIKDLSKFVANTTVAAINGQPIRATPVEATRRYNICLTCPFLADGKCAKCGCKMGLKVQWQEVKCADKENPLW